MSRSTLLIPFFLCSIGPASACLAPHVNEEIDIRATYESLPGTDQYIVSINAPPEFQGAPLASVMVTVSENDRQLFQASVKADAARGLAPFEMADHLLDLTQVTVRYGPGSSGLCAEVGEMRLARPAD